MDHLAEEGSRRARMVSGLLQHLSFHLPGAQLGITSTSLVIPSSSSVKQIKRKGRERFLFTIA